MLGVCEFEDGDTVFNIEECENSIFVCYTPSVVHELFYLLFKMNQLHHKNVRNDNTRSTQFDINTMTIQENTSYYDVASTIQTLNTHAGEPVGGNSVATPYVYNGQTIHRLAHEYYEGNHNNDYKSEMSPQIAYIFNDPLSRNTAFNVTLHDTQATDAYDFNKLYSSILKQLNDKFGWAQFQPNDYVERFDGVISTGFYLINCKNYLPLRGNGWYSDSVICDALDLKMIAYDDIRYQIKASKRLDTDFLKEFVLSVVEQFNGYKSAINGFIWIFFLKKNIQQH
jgi:hypothetical protein